MARRVNLGDYGISEALKPEDLGGATHAVLTVKEVDPEVYVQEGDGDRKSLVIRFVEFPDLAFWPNKTGLRYMVAELGDDVDKWIGAKIPLQAVTTQNPRTHEPTDNLWVCKAGTWDQHIANAAKKRTRKTAKRKTAKRSR